MDDAKVKRPTVGPYGALRQTPIAIHRCSVRQEPATDQFIPRCGRPALLYDKDTVIVPSVLSNSPRIFFDKVDLTSDVVVGSDEGLPWKLAKADRVAGFHESPLLFRDVIERIAAPVDEHRV